MVRFLLPILLFCLCLSSLCYAKHHGHHSYHNATGSCKAVEKRALLQFKQGLRDPRGMLSSWEGDNCCIWRGVHCDQLTGNVIKLDLRCDNCYSNASALQGQFGTSLLHLKYLEDLDVSGNNFMHSHIPNSIGSLTQLKHLDFSEANFGGSVPIQFGKLTNLVYLNISYNPVAIDSFWLSNLTALHYLDLNSVDFTRAVSVGLRNLTSLRYLDLLGYNCMVKTINWVSHLTNLRHLDMSYCNFEDNTTSILQELNMLPFISEVYLGGISLEKFPSLHGHINFTILSTLDLSYNQFLSVPGWLANITSLQHLSLKQNSMKEGIFTIIGSLCKLKSLDASSNNFVENLSTSNTNLSHCANYELEILSLSTSNFMGPLPDWIARHQNLKHLDLSNNELHGPIPDSFGSLMNLQELWLQKNNLVGNIPLIISQLTKLIDFDVHANNLNGTLSELHFCNLTSLKYLDLSSNLLELSISGSWVPPFRLESLLLDSCKIGPHFPQWLQAQDKLQKLNLANTGLSGILPTWIWDFSNDLSHIDLADNNLYGNLPHLQSPNSFLFYLNLSSNKFEGLLPHFHSQIFICDLSNNMFSGPMSQIESWPIMPDMNFLYLSSNQLTVIIPQSICNLKGLQLLDISTNYLTGALPNCLKGLQVLNVENNYINGSGFTSTTAPCELKSLYLRNNSLYGSFPLSLQNCKSIVLLDIGENKITGVIPYWLADSFTKMWILRLRANHISGTIPRNLPHMTSLKVLDLANNNLVGNIPKNFGQFSSMMSTNYMDEGFVIVAYDRAISYDYFDNVLLNIKHQKRNFNRILPLVRSIDLSSNSLSSEIPKELGNLVGLVNLDLSQNIITGRIPEEFRNLKLLESLDLSMNKLSGEIPASLSYMTSLSYLNLSFNNLSGIIPSGNQFSTFTAETYMENPYLCGAPLKQCEQASNRTILGNVNEADDKQNKNKDDGYETRCLVIGTIFCFILGFWIFNGSLILNKSWRYAYYGYIHAWGDQLYR